jgi:hypothetical protein
VAAEFRRRDLGADPLQEWLSHGAYIGKLSVDDPSHVSGFAFPLLLFVAGSLAVAIRSGVTYLSQWFYFGEGDWK